MLDEKLFVCQQCYQNKVDADFFRTYALLRKHTCIQLVRARLNADKGKVEVSTEYLRPQ